MQHVDGNVLAVLTRFGARVRRYAQPLAFAGVAIAGIALVDVAAREASARTETETAKMIPASQIFANLRPCEIPGVDEHLIARGAKTLTYAGEFSPTAVTPWTTGQARIFLYVVEGSGIVRIGAATLHAHAGDFFVIPKGARHAVSAGSAKLRAIYFEDRT